MNTATIILSWFFMMLSLIGICAIGLCISSKLDD